MLERPDDPDIAAAGCDRPHARDRHRRCAGGRWRPCRLPYLRQRPRQGGERNESVVWTASAQLLDHGTRHADAQGVTLYTLLQAEGRRFIAALERAAVAKRSALFDAAELYTIADRIELQAEVPALLEDLRDAGEQCAVRITDCGSWQRENSRQVGWGSMQSGG